MTRTTSTDSHRTTPVRRLAGLAVALSVGLALVAPAWGTVYTYENTASGPIPEVASDEGCLTSGLVREFTVAETFTVSGIALGLNATHPYRGDIRAVLVAPNGTSSAVFLTQQSDSSYNYDILISSNNDGAGVPAQNDGNADPTVEPYFNRLVNLAGANFYTGSAFGTWTLYVCDRFPVDDGTFNRARLVLTDASARAPVCTSTSTYDWGSNGDGVAFTSTTVSGVTLSMSGTPILNNPPMTPSAYNFVTRTTTTGSEAGHYRIEWDSSRVEGNPAPRSEVTFAFNPPVRDLSWKALDVDQGRWEDYVRVRGLSSTGSEVPYNIVTDGTPSYQLAGEIIEGDSGAASNQTYGNSVWAFDGPVASVRTEFWPGDDFADPTQQFIGIGDPYWCAFDLGDAPDTYGTSIASDGARHVLGTRSVYLGSVPPDGEVTDPSSYTALNDDTRTVGGVDDEDGVAAFPAAGGGTSYTVPVVASNESGSPAYLVGYLDWGRDGSFAQAVDRSATVTVPAGARATSFDVTWSGLPPSAFDTTGTYARLRISTNQASVESPTGQAPDGEVEDYEIPSGSLPVSLAWVEVMSDGRDLRVRFMTADERLNLGFSVWGVTDAAEPVLLARTPSVDGDSSAPQAYEVRIAAERVRSVLLEDLSVDGRSRLHGPFPVGTTFGEIPEVVPIDWDLVRRETGVVSVAERLTAAAEGRTLQPAQGEATSSGALLLAAEEGIHRVTYEDLLAAGVDLGGVSTTDIALLDGGRPVPRVVSGGLMRGPRTVFGPGGYVEFLARPRLTLESPADAYELRVDPRSALSPAGIPPAGGAEVVVTAFDRYHPDRRYSFSAPNGDPWYDLRVQSSGAPVAVTRSFDLPDLADGKVMLHLEVWGGSAFDGSAPDHHLQVRLNGSDVASARFDGITPWSGTFDVTEVALAAGNTLELCLPGDTGYELDRVHLEGFSVTYPRWSVARDGRFHVTLSADSSIAVSGFSDREAVVVWTTEPSGVARDRRLPAHGLVQLPALDGEVHLATESRLLRAAIMAEIPTPQSASEAEYLIVTHPVFAGAMDALVALEQARGFSTEVVTTDRIFAAYSDHASSSEAVRRFVAASLDGGRLRYLLLVGADTVDPHDHLGLGSVSFVPSAYKAIGPVVAFSPTDEVLADADGDGLGEVPVGRLPVRTAGELEAAVAKIATWEALVGERQAFLVAGASDDGRSLSVVNTTYADALAGWDTELLQVDDVGPASARQATLSALDQGVPLVSFVGHSSPGQWDFNVILRWQDVATLANRDRPNLVAQWGCWNSYAVDPAYRSLSSYLLLTPDVGAAGVIGAATLTSDASHQRLGSLFFEHASAGTKTVGEALRAAKRTLHGQHVAQDAVLGMSLFGDPAMSLPPPAR